ncbi:unnamed protein product [Protopolystoma xenopodis]|uniref:Uncharacterized protein n=1 Tax=Protopolystoma xenopodis TaxID=117903 RepID=A0A448XR65_9PLAT|nr:unnamed protein product [Protopolystoma xenopodis]
MRTGSSDRVDIDPDLSSTSEILTTGSINDSSNLLVDICKAVGLMRSRARFIRRRLPNNIQEHPLIFGPEVAANIELALRLLGDTVLILYGAVVNAAQMASNQTVFLGLFF